MNSIFGTFLIPRFLFVVVTNYKSVIFFPPRTIAVSLKSTLFFSNIVLSKCCLVRFFMACLSYTLYYILILWPPIRRETHFRTSRARSYFWIFFKCRVTRNGHFETRNSHKNRKLSNRSCWTVRSFKSPSPRKAFTTEVTKYVPWYPFIYSYYNT